MSNRTRAFATALGGLLISGLLYQTLAADSTQLNEAAARVALVPNVIGPWQGQDDPPDEAAFAQTGAKGYWVRTYVHEKTRASVQVILMCGRPGKMGVHTPEVCYSGAGYTIDGQPAAINVQNASEFWSAKFTKKTGQLRLAWAWNARGEWEASSSPRWHFRGEPFLYKLYVSCDVSGTQADVTTEFLRAFLPVAKQTLFDEPGA